MHLIGYNCGHQVSASLPRLLEANGIEGITQRVKGNERLFCNREGEIALIVSNTFIESQFHLPNGHDMRLHAALIASKCSHVGHIKLASWPPFWMIARELYPAEIIIHALNAEYFGHQQYFARISGDDVSLWIGAAVNKLGALVSYVCPEGGSNIVLEYSKVWEDAVAILEGYGFSKANQK